MSKLYDTYILLKKQDKNTIYLFKSGVFFIALDDDAYTLSKIFNFKLGNLNENIVKCGFPCSSFNKYSNLFKLHNLDVKFIEKNNTVYTTTEYKQNNTISELINAINLIDTEHLSISEAYQTIEDLKNKVKELEM